MDKAIDDAASASRFALSRLQQIVLVAGRQCSGVGSISYESACNAARAAIAKATGKETTTA